MSKNFDEFADLFLSRLNRGHASAAGYVDAASYIFENRGKLLEDAFQGYIDSNFENTKSPRILKVVKKMNLLLGSIFETNRLDLELHKKIGNEIRQKALDDGIPIITKVKLRKREWFANDVLCLDGLDKESSIKECFKWINCVCEYSFGEPFFARNGSELADTRSVSPVIPKKERAILESIESLGGQAIEALSGEELINYLNVQGFLHCDLRE